MSPALRWAPPGCFLLSACGILLAVWLPCSVACLGFRPALLAVSEFFQDTALAHAHARRCLSLLTVLRDSNGLPFPVALPFSAIRCMSMTAHCFPGFAFMTHPCSTNGAHAVMVCVVMIQAHLHALPSSCPPRLSFEPLFSLPVTFHKSPCLTWCMRRGLRPDVHAARARD